MKKSKAKKSSKLRQNQMLDFAKKAAFTYGSYVVSNRAVPDVRDGLKPVHRLGLWAMHELGLHQPAKFKKSARIVGDTLGKYHPHGDTACYDALVSLANYDPNLIQGQGNWGSPVDKAAAYRYTEARLSKFASLFILNKDYLPVAEYEPNFNDEYKQPVSLPALLPNILTMGNPTIPAYGVRAGNPSFELDGIVKLVIHGLKRGGETTSGAVLKHLRPTHWLGSDWLEDEAELKELLTTGRGALTWRSKIDADFKQRTIRATTYCPGFRSPESISKKILKIVNMDGVSDMRNASNKKDKKSGKFGAQFVIKVGRNVGEDKFYDILESIEKELTASESYALGFTVRHSAVSNKETSFHYANYIRTINSWLAYRIRLETKLIKHEIVEIGKKLRRQEMLLFAALNADTLIKTVRSVKKAAKGKGVLESVALAVQKKFKLEYEDAKMLSEIPLYRISNLEVTLIRKAIKEYKQQIRERKKQLKEPGVRAAQTTAELYKKFKK